MILVMFLLKPKSFVHRIIKRTQVRLAEFSKWIKKKKNQCFLLLPVGFNFTRKKMDRHAHKEINISCPFKTTPYRQPSHIKVQKIPL